VGAAFAARLKKDPTVVMAYMGDGATSSADFHVAMNFAGVWKAPVVFVCQNNHWSISVPTERQTASESIAIKAKAYGFPGVKIDGNDVFAVYAASRNAVDRARRGEGPSLVELETYRIGAHSSSDDPTRYRDNREVEAWKARDPLEQLRKKLSAAKKWTERRDSDLREELLADINAAIAAVEPLGPCEDLSLFDDVYASLPWNLVEERSELAG
jgi:pyruvate dehydrogenase E1 component alpha subunit/2-oxoisovalerate dehydrogenase E1 component alpha subunit